MTAKRTRVLRQQRTKNLESDGLTVELDVAGTTQRVAEAVAKHHREAIAAGDKPSGGPQRPLGRDQARRAAKGQRNPERGMGTQGRFAASIRTGRKPRGTTKATSTVAGDAFFDVFLGQEDRRGVEYLSTSGDVERIVDRVLTDELNKALDDT
ncbi:MAG: hypothetical protein AAFP15_16000 [Bacteroidota bacterium]